MKSIAGTRCRRHVLERDVAGDVADKQARLPL
jgi:hypothetical protein